MSQQEAGGLLKREAGTASFEQEVIDPPELRSRPAPPLWAWLLLVAAVAAVSSAGVVFAKLVEVPPITLAAWRLQLTSVFLGIGAAVQFRGMPATDRRRTLEQAGLLAASGTCLCAHFGLWVYSVEATSLTHSLLFVSATPLFLAGGTWLLGKPISRGELAGTAVGLAGGVLLATAAAKSDAQVTLRGDMAALLASVAFVGYLLIGQMLRSWMPAFVYAFSVTGLAALELTLGALLLEGASLMAVGLSGVFGWVGSSHYLPYILYLSVVPGIVGHTGFNTLLRYLNPLIISLACNLEPLIGSLLGWAVGVVAAPGVWTYVGGALVMVSTAVVSLASHFREKGAASREAAAQAIQRIFGLGDSGEEDEEDEEDEEFLGLVAVADGTGGGKTGSAGQHRGSQLPAVEDSGWGEAWNASRT